LIRIASGTRAIKNKSFYANPVFRSFQTENSQGLTLPLDFPTNAGIRVERNGFAVGGGGIA